MGSHDNPSAGIPKPRIEITRIVGIPRNRSVYAIASARIGKKTGPGSDRRTARKSAAGRISASDVQKSFTFSQKASRISGKLSR